MSHGTVPRRNRTAKRIGIVRPLHAAMCDNETQFTGSHDVIGASVLQVATSQESLCLCLCIYRLEKLANVINKYLELCLLVPRRPDGL